MGFLAGGRRQGTDRPEASRPGPDQPEIGRPRTDRPDIGVPAMDRSVVSAGVDPVAADQPATGNLARAAVAQADGYVPAPAGFVERVVVTLSGVRQPIVAVLLLIAFFTVLSGKPLDGLLLSVVATALAWDAGMRARESTARALTASELPQRSAWRLRARRPAARLIALGMSLAVFYSLIVGSFTRFSWPATAGVAGLGAGVVIIGWGGATRKRTIPGKFARAGVTVWGSLFIAASLWELGALLGQPNFETGSYAHPTISTLTDPLLSSSLGRSVALMSWIALGFFLVDR